MAKRIVPPATDDEWRVELASVANSEIHYIVAMLRRECDEDREGFDCILRTSLRRLAELSDAICSLEMKDEETQRMACVVYGEDCLVVEGVPHG